MRDAEGRQSAGSAASDLLGRPEPAPKGNLILLPEAMATHNFQELVSPHTAEGIAEIDEKNAGVSVSSSGQGVISRSDAGGDGGPVGNVCVLVCEEGESGGGNPRGEADAQALLNHLGRVAGARDWPYLGDFRHGVGGLLPEQKELGVEDVAPLLGRERAPPAGVKQPGEAGEQLVAAGALLARRGQRQTALAVAGETGLVEAVESGGSLESAPQGNELASSEETLASLRRE